MRQLDHRAPLRLQPRDLVCGAAAAVLLATTAPADVVKHRTVAVTGEAAPGTNTTISDIQSNPRINLHGQVAFFAELANGDLALYRTALDDPATLELIARSGDDIPGGPFDVTLGDEFEGLVLNDDGSIAFGMTVDNLNEAWNKAIFRFADGTLETVALPGRQVPGAAPGVEYADIDPPWMNAHDLVAFRATLQGPGVNPNNDNVIMTTSFGGITQLARSGSPAPGRPGDVFGDLYGGMIANNGRVAFYSRLNQDDDEASVWTGYPGLLDLALVANEGVPSVAAVLGYSIYDDGIFVTTAGPLAHLRDTGNGIDPVVVLGDAGPLGTYAFFDDFYRRTNASGSLLFPARFNGPVADRDSAIVHIDGNGQHSVIAREGDPALGYWNGVEIDHVGSYYTANVAFDNPGRLYYLVPLRGPAIHAGNDTVLYARNINGSVDDLMREGQILEARQGDYRIVDDFSFIYGYGTQSGRPGPANDAGDIALAVSFNDGSEAIVVAQLDPFCAGDFNSDGRIDVDDLVILILNWGQPAAVGTDGDADRNGFVDVNDLVELILSWGFCV